MFVELVDALRCTESHAETQLVAAQTSMHGRHIVDGVLGCPLCLREYRIAGGVAHFGEPPAAGIAGADSVEPSAYEALRCAALLDLQSPNGFVLLAGEWGELAGHLIEVAAVHYVLLNPPSGMPIPDTVSVIRHGAAIPFAGALARGAALDATAASLTGVQPFAAAVRGGGRLVAPIDTPLPADSHILASDDRHWVAEVSHPALSQISLRRNPG